MRKLYLTVVGAALSALAFASSALAAPDPTVTQVKTDVLAYFGDNLPTVILAVVGVSMTLWFISLIFRATGARRKSL